MVPQELKDLTQWVNWAYEGETKVPKNSRTGGNAAVNYPNTWNTYEAAVERGSKYNLGIGFVLTEADPYTIIDLDDCWGRGGFKNEQAQEIAAVFHGAYIELSPSMTGLHIVLKSELAVNRRTQGIEVYSSGRWITFSGRANPNAPQIIPDRTEELQWLMSQFFPQEAPKTVHNPSEVLPDDAAIWDRLFNSPNGATFQALFNGDVSVTRNDHSRGVIFLANMLAMMTDGDASRMERLLRQTGLANEKWDSKRGNISWLDHQIRDAILWASGRKK